MALSALRALCVGDCCLDCYLPPIDATFVGGQSVNVAVGLVREGLDVSWAGVVGSDDAGRTITGALTTHGLGLSLTRAETGATGVALIGVDADGERHIVDEQYGVSAPVTAAPEVLAAAAAMDLVFAAHVANLDALAAAIGQHGALGVDLSEEPVAVGSWVHRARFLFLSRPQASLEALLAEARDAIMRGACEVIVTRGKAGAVVITAAEVVPMPAVATQVADTLGAGDAHAASYMAQRLAGRTVSQSLTAASIAAAAACQHLGAWAPAPSVAGSSHR